MLPVCAVLLINNLLVPSYLLFSFTCPMIIHPSMLSQPFIVDALALLVYKSTTLDKTIPSFIILIIPLQSVTHCMLFAYRSRLINCKMSARRLILLFIHNSQLNTSLVFSFAPCPTMDDGLTLTWLTWQQEREREKDIPGMWMWGKLKTHARICMTARKSAKLLQSKQAVLPSTDYAIGSSQFTHRRVVCVLAWQLAQWKE